MVFPKGALSPLSSYSARSRSRFFDREEETESVRTPKKDYLRPLSPFRRNRSPSSRSSNKKKSWDLSSPRSQSSSKSRQSETKPTSTRSCLKESSRPEEVEARDELTLPIEPTDETRIQKLITEGLWTETPDGVEEVLNQLSNLLFTNDEGIKTIRRDAMYRSGGHLAIVQAMKRNGHHKGIQTQGCRALANATWETSEFMHAICAVGGINAIVDAMTQFRKDEVVQICGSCALRNLTSLRKIAAMIVQRDGLPTIVAAMRTFPMNPNIQECGCWTIAHLCRDENMNGYMQKAKCFSVIGSAADYHPKHADVLMAARQASERLWNLISSTTSSSSS